MEVKVIQANTIISGEAFLAATGSGYDVTFDMVRELHGYRLRKKHGEFTLVCAGNEATETRGARFCHW